MEKIIPHVQGGPWIQVQTCTKPFITGRGPPCIESKSSTISRCQNRLFGGMLSQLPLVVCHIAWITRDGMDIRYEPYFFCWISMKLIYISFIPSNHYICKNSYLQTLKIIDINCNPQPLSTTRPGGQGTRMEKSSKPSGSSTIKVSPDARNRLEEMVVWWDSLNNPGRRSGWFQLSPILPKANTWQFPCWK